MILDSETLSDRDFRRMQELIGGECGIDLAPGKRIMLEARLKRRARAVGSASLAAYCDFVQRPEGRAREWDSLVDAVTTHKTDFFREPAHFDYLADHAVPTLAESGAGLRRPLRVWSAASSTGEEPYTLAMVLSECAAAMPSADYRFQIDATDISTGVLETARRGVYPESAVEPVPLQLRRRYMLRSKDRSKHLVRMAPGLRHHISFRPLNLIDQDYGFREPLDIVFCRNVMIYFTRPKQQMILTRIVSHLCLGGFLMMGHSESLNGLDLPLAQVTPTVYRRLNA
jgi:chemotaxis protein methyltransferase CheR